MTRWRGRHTRAFVWEGWQKPARAGEELFCRHVALLQPEVGRFRSLPQAPSLGSFFRAPRYTARYCEGSVTAGINRTSSPGSVRVMLTQPVSGSWCFIPVYQNRASEIPRRGAVPGKQQPRVHWNLLRAQPRSRIIWFQPTPAKRPRHAALYPQPPKSQLCNPGLHFSDSRP